jgi:hypothetical protein
MPHITTETTKEIRKEIKKTFPNMKFSVTRRHHSTICVTLLESPIESNSDNYQLNHFYLENEENKEIAKVFTKVLEIINSHKGQAEESYDSDYGSIPNFYINFSVGRWDKPYKRILNNESVKNNTIIAF